MDGAFRLQRWRCSFPRAMPTPQFPATQEPPPRATPTRHAVRAGTAAPSDYGVSGCMQVVAWTAAKKRKITLRVARTTAKTGEFGCRPGQRSRSISNFGRGPGHRSWQSTRCDRCLKVSCHLSDGTDAPDRASHSAGCEEICYGRAKGRRRIRQR